MPSLNEVRLMGHLGRDAELKYTPAGHPFATFSLATTDSWRDKAGQWQEHTEWHRVTLWGESAERLAPRLTKGVLIYVDGAIQTRAWEDRDGQKRSATEIKARRVLCLDRRRRSDDEVTVGVVDALETATDTSMDTRLDDDIPF